LLLVGKPLLLLIEFVLIECLLRSDVETAAYERISINVMNRITAHALNEFVGWQSSQHLLALWRIRRPDDEPRCREVVFVLRDDLLLSLARSECAHA
jgi:hypothetical protein